MEMVAVDMGIYSEQPLENGLHQVGELRREGSTDLGREDVVVIKEALNPVHQVLDIFTGRQRDRSFGQQHRSISASRQCFLPQILVFFSGDHSGACSGRAELGDCSVEHVDLVVEVDNVDSQPLVHVLVLGQFDGLYESIVRPESLFGVVTDVFVG